MPARTIASPLSAFVLVAGLVLLLTGAATPAHAALPADGSAITTIGGGTGWAGEDTGSATGLSTSIAIQADGKIITAETIDPAVQAYAQLTRRDAAGVLDPTFGTAGVAQLAIGAGQTIVHDVGIDSLGRIVAAGTYTSGGATGTNAFVLRLAADGSPDVSFDGDGIYEVELCATRDDGAYALHVQADDAILVGGFAHSGCAGGAPELAMFRVTAAGVLDPTFGVGGVLDAHAVPGTGSEIMSITQQADGEILAAGQAEFGFPGFVARIHPNGTYDATFGTGGISTLSDFTWVASVIAQADGTIMVGGEGLSSGGAVQRLAADGSVDPTYGAAGIANTPGDHFFTLGGVVGNMGAAVQPDGSYLLCGSVMDIMTFADPYYDLGVARFTPDGQLDTTFGTNGYAATHAAGWAMGEEAVGDCAMGSNGQLFAAGFTNRGLSGADYRVPVIAGWYTRTDFIKPTASATAAVSDHVVTFTIVANDAGSGLEDVAGAYSFDAGTTWQVSPSFAITGLMPGTTRLANIRVRDRSGNISLPLSVSGTSTPDYVAPTATVATSSGYDYIDYAVTATDASAGIDGAAYSFDGGASWQAASTFHRTGLKPKTSYQLLVHVRDAVGNVAFVTTSTSTQNDGTPIVHPVAFDSSRVPRSLAPRWVRLYDITNAYGSIVSVTADFRGRTIELTDGMLDMRRFTEGTATLTIRATDSDGDVGVYTKKFRVDRTAPRFGAAASHFVLGPVLVLKVTDAGAGVTKSTVSTRLPRGLGSSVITARVSDRDGNVATRRFKVTRRLALSDQRLNFGLRLRTKGGSRIDPTQDAVRASFRFLGTAPPWYVSSDLQTPFVTEAQWRLVHMGCLPQVTARDGVLDIPTIRAVQRYQRAKGLPILGTIGPRTRAALDRDLLIDAHVSCA